MSRATPTSDLALVCPRCDRPGTGVAGCQHCAVEGVFVNLLPPLTELAGRDLATYRGGPWAWPEALSLAPSTTPVTLGEGNTPCLRVGGGDGGGLWLKNEATNPTWSHKDRGMSVAVARAVEEGADTVVAPSSGNAGLAAAAYAARAGLRAVILTVVGMPASYQALLHSLGAVLVAFESDDDRYAMARAAVDELGWYPAAFVDPRVGGNPYGNSGYKSVAYELARDFGDRLGRVVVPTARADLLSGIARGFEELVAAGLLAQMPHLIAAEADTGAAFATALALGDPDAQERVVVERLPSAAFSIGNESAHWQGLRALRVSNGWAVAVDEPTYLAEQRRIAREMGLVVESAAAVAIAAGRRTARDVPDWVTVAISTSAGMKDPAMMTPPAESLTVLPADVAALADHARGSVHPRIGHSIDDAAAVLGTAE